MASAAPIILDSSQPRHLRWLLVAVAALGVLSALTADIALWWKCGLVVITGTVAIRGWIRLSDSTKHRFILHPGADRWQRTANESSQGSFEHLQYQSCLYNGQGHLMVRFSRPGRAGNLDVAFFRRHNCARDFRRVKIWLQ